MYWWMCLIDFWNFLTIHVFGVKESIADIPTELPCLVDLENSGQLPVQEVIEVTHACAFGRVDEAVSGGKPPAGKGVVGLLSWHDSHFWVCITFCKVHHGDSVTKPDYYYYYFYYRHPCVAKVADYVLPLFIFFYFIFFYSPFVLRNYSTDSHQIFQELCILV